MSKLWEGAPRLADRIRSSPRLFAAVLIGAAAVAIVVGLKVGELIRDESAEERNLDDPEGFAAWLFGGRDEAAAVDQYLEAERELRDKIAKQVQLEQQGDDRARVLRGLGALAQPWDWLGPRNWGGRTRAFVINPDDPDVMLAGGITGGVWRSQDRGASWVPLTDTFSNIAINVLEIDPSNPLVVYAGTGEAYYKGAPKHRGNGIMKSTDGGISWAFLQATVTDRSFDWVGDIEVSHGDPDRVYAATGTGVWISSDGGESWGSRPVLPARDAHGVGCLELAIRSDRTRDVLFASCGTRYSPDGAYRSTDAGLTWDPILPVGDENAAAISLAIAPSNQDLVYASVGDTSGNALGLYVSEQGGAPGSWVLRAGPSTGAPNWFGYCSLPTRDGQGGYVTSIAVDPVDPNRVWLGGIDLYRSEDGGRSMRVVSDWALLPEDGTAYVHADQHAIVFHPGYDGASNRTVYFAHDGGLSRTDDDRAPVNGGCQGMSGVRFDALNNGYGIAQFVGASVSEDGRIVIGGTQDNGTFRLDVGGTSDWVSIWGADGGQTVMGPGAEWMVVSTYYGSFIRLEGAARAQRLDECREVYADECARAGIDRYECGEDCVEFYPPLERDSTDQLWSVGRTIWRSPDHGDTWKEVGSVGADTGTAIAVAPTDPNIVYVGTYGGVVHRSGNAGAASPAWAPVEAPFPEGRQVSAITIDPVDPSTVFVAFKSFDGQQLWRSLRGAPFQPMDGDLPETPVNTVAINPRNPAMVYAGTDVGVFESLDGGLTWRVANENLATTIVSELLFRTGTSELYAFTFGRGAYRVDVGDRSPPVNDLVTNAKEVVLAPDYRDVVDIRSASSAPGDPSLSCGSALVPAQTRSVWYRLVPAEGGRIAVTTEGSNFDTVLAVHLADAAGELLEIECNDESVAALGQSSLVFEADPGATYYVEVTRSASSPADTLANSLNLTISRP